MWRMSGSPRRRSASAEVRAHPAGRPRAMPSRACSSRRMKMANRESPAHEGRAMAPMSGRVMTSRLGPYGRAARPRRRRAKCCPSAGSARSVRRLRSRCGVEVNFSALDQTGRRWLFDVSGAFSVTQRPGLRRTDTLWKAIGRASVLHTAGCDQPLVLLTTDRPAPSSAGHRAPSGSDRTRQAGPCGHRDGGPPRLGSPPNSRQRRSLSGQAVRIVRLPPAASGRD